MNGWNEDDLMMCPEEKLSVILEMMTEGADGNNSG